MSRIPIRQNRRNLIQASPDVDRFMQEPYLRRRDRRMSRSIGAAGGDSWRPLTIRERLDIRAGLRRETERDRMRLSRERDLSLRRLRMREELETQGTDRFPPLRELILRRLRGRNGGGTEAEDDDLLPPSTGGGAENRDRSRHREMLSWMVDQLTIDHEGEAEQLDSINIPGSSGPGGGAGAAAQPPTAGPSVGPAGDRRPPRYSTPRDRHRDLGHIGDRLEAGERRREPDNMFVRAGERRLFRDYHFLHHGPSNIALTHR